LSIYKQKKRGLPDRALFFRLFPKTEVLEKPHSLSFKSQIVKEKSPVPDSATVA
jgi:hypothetical protein